ncbi:hypothetical protein SODALDRAFT_56485 [Sodiomyces alkalinus F11]|uniref:Uncharacterized protein n=1 Tax=Sodiomyces alkalinus (strain CBS 110278 / VKM F-3762 / F11) TaxID=1314773 RepID=A0A3N2PNL6_SODAK|nr:hypothetical protein SODALDRAFT_56485 [Sodiomyces alkalinus F11]ROT36024.1 hypothetical protein SODALDRAFT_56485 [Sodiomyces alkalinus F11]
MRIPLQSTIAAAAQTEHILGRDRKAKKKKRRKKKLSSSSLVGKPVLLLFFVFFFLLLISAAISVLSLAAYFPGILCNG